MAKPDTEDGWFKKSVELEAALAFAGFTDTARTLLRYVFLQIFGRGQRPTLAYLPQGVIAKRIGVKRQVVHRAVRELVESGVLFEMRDDQYRFAKDYETWVTWARDSGRRGEPRLGPQQIKDCKEAPDYARSFEVKPKAENPPQPSTNGTTPVIPLDDAASSNGMTLGTTSVIQRDDAASSNGMTGVIQRDDVSAGAIEDRPRKEEFKKRNTEGRREEPPPLSAPLSRAEGTPLPKPLPQDERDLATVAASCREWFPGRPEIAEAVAGRQGGYPVAWYRLAAERLRGRDPGKQNRDYLIGILGRFETEGLPPESRPRPSTTSLIPAFRPSPEELAERARLKLERNGKH